MRVFEVCPCRQKSLGMALMWTVCQAEINSNSVTSVGLKNDSLTFSVKCFNNRWSERQNRWQRVWPLGRTGPKTIDLTSDLRGE